VSEDGNIGLEDPGRSLRGGLYGERTIGRSGKTAETEIG